MTQALIDTFGLSLSGVFALVSVHAHIGLIGMRIRRVEHTPTVAQELKAVPHHV